MKKVISEGLVSSIQGPIEAGPLTFEFTWNEAEHARLIRAMMRHRLTGWLNRAIVPIIFGGFLLFVLVIPLVRPNADPVAVWIAAAPWLLILGIWFAILRWGLPYLNARTFRRDNHCARHPMRRIISVQGLRLECETTATDIRWQGMHGVVETPEFFLFYVTRSCAVELPKRAIPTQQDLKRLRLVLSQQLGDRARLLVPLSSP
jgi:YcxB-like protein